MDSIKNDNYTTISFFKEEVANFIKKRDWIKYHTPKNLIQALGIEVAELSEIFLFKDYETKKIRNNKVMLESISNEIADIFIYLISFINILDLDLTKCFIRKMEKNNQKYSVEEFNDGLYYKK